MIGDGLVVIHRSDASLSRGAVFQCLPIVPLTCVLSVLFLMQYAARCGTFAKRGQAATFLTTGESACFTQHLLSERTCVE